MNWTGSQLKILDFGDWKKVSRSQLISLGATVVLGKFVSDDYILSNIEGRDAEIVFYGLRM